MGELRHVSEVGAGVRCSFAFGTELAALNELRA